MAGQRAHDTRALSNMGRTASTTVLILMGGAGARVLLHQLPKEMQTIFISIVVGLFALLWGLHFLYKATRKPF